MRVGDQFAQSYRAVRLGGAREAARHAALTLLAYTGRISGRTARALSKPRIQLLNLHHVFPDEEEGFRELLTRLAQQHTFISYSEAVRRLYAREIAEPSIAISFDDGLKSCRSAARIMAEFGVSACFFICPSLIGEKNTARMRERLRFRAVEPMDWDDVEHLVHSGHEIGNHTMDHAHCASLSASEFGEQLQRAQEMLERHGSSGRHFAWPFGTFADILPEQVALLFNSGFETCAASLRGCHVSDQRPRERWEICLRRDLIIAGWPLDHSLYLLARSAANGLTARSSWPDGWHDRIAAQLAAAS